MSDGRLVWIDREQYNMLRSLMQTWPDVARPIVAAWDAAPADPVRITANAIYAAYTSSTLNQDAERLLIALGMPEASS